MALPMWCRSDSSSDVVTLSSSDHAKAHCARGSVTISCSVLTTLFADGLSSWLNTCWAEACFPMGCVPSTGAEATFATEVYATACRRVLAGSLEVLQEFAFVQGFRKDV